MSISRTLSVVQHHLVRTASPTWSDFLDDPRKARGKRWSFAEIMRAMWAGVLVAAPTLRAVEALTERMGRRISDTTLWGLLTKLKPKGFREHLVREVRAAWRAKELTSLLPLSQVAVDGKTIWVGKHKANRYCQRQEHDGMGVRYHMRMLRATYVSSPTQLCLGQAPIPARQNDMSSFHDFFTWLVKQYGRSGIMQVISVDAGFASKKNADQIDEAEPGYLIALKSPQHELYTEAVRLLGGKQKPDVQTPWEHTSGKRIRRLLFRTEEMAGWNGWTHLRQVWRVRQETERGDTATVEERYFLTNVTVGPTKGDVPLHMVRAHWGIENGNNWTMDVVWNEDDCPWASAALEVVSWMRLLAMNVVMRLRTRHLRSEGNRSRPWKVLLRFIEDIVIRTNLLPRALGPPGIVEETVNA